MNSNFGHINLADIGKGVLMTVLTTVVGGIYTATSTGNFPTATDLKTWGAGGIAAGIAYLMKNLFTNSGNQVFSQEANKKPVGTP